MIIVCATLALGAGPARGDVEAEYKELHPRAASLVTPRGVELGLRSGYSLPMGGAGDSSYSISGPLSDAFSGLLSIRIDGGYRVSPHLYVGADFQYGIAFINVDKTQCGTGVSSFSFANSSMGSWDCSADQLVPFNQPYKQTLGVNGVLFDVELGVDYKLTGSLGIGPFILLSMGQFSNCSYAGSVYGESSPCSIPNQTLHEWLTIGVRGAYDFGS